MRYSRKACSLEFNNAHSRDSIVVESREGVTIAHVPDGLARIINPLMQDGRIQRVAGVAVNNDSPKIMTPQSLFTGK